MLNQDNTKLPILVKRIKYVYFSIKSKCLGEMFLHSSNIFSFSMYLKIIIEPITDTMLNKKPKLAPIRIAIYIL